MLPARPSFLPTLIATACMASLCRAGYYPEFFTCKANENKYFRVSDVEKASSIRLCRSGDGLQSMNIDIQNEWAAHCEQAYADGIDSDSPLEEALPKFLNNRNQNVLGAPAVCLSDMAKKFFFFDSKVAIPWHTLEKGPYMFSCHAVYDSRNIPWLRIHYDGKQAKAVQTDSCRSNLERMMLQVEKRKAEYYQHKAGYHPEFFACMDDFVRISDVFEKASYINVYPDDGHYTMQIHMQDKNSILCYGYGMDQGLPSKQVLSQFLNNRHSNIPNAPAVHLSNDIHERFFFFDDEIAIPWHTLEKGPFTIACESGSLRLKSQNWKEQKTTAVAVENCQLKLFTMLLEIEKRKVLKYHTASLESGHVKA